MQYKTIQYNATQYNTTEHNTDYDTIQNNTKRNINKSYELTLSLVCTTPAQVLPLYVPDLFVLLF